MCPVCKTNFHTRLRVLAHLSDKRRTSCSSALVAGAHPRLASEEVLRLNQIAEAWRNARRDGHTHAIAVMSAVTEAGKRIGHVRC